MTIDPGVRSGTPTADQTRLRDVAAEFEALLFKEAFAPLSKAMGFYGDTVVATAAQALTRGAGAALTAPLEAAMSSSAQTLTRSDGAPR